MMGGGVSKVWKGGGRSLEDAKNWETQKQSLLGRCRGCERFCCRCREFEGRSVEGGHCCL